MNNNFKTLIENARVLAGRENIVWDIAVDSHGIAIKGHEWNLRLMSKDGKPTQCVLRQFSEFLDAQAELAKRGLLENSEVGPRAVSIHWQDLMKAFVLDHVVVKKKSLSFATSASQAWRFLATVARKEPWLVTVDDLRLACDVSDVCQNTKSRTINLLALTRNFVDPWHLFDACPLSAQIDRIQAAADNRAKFAKASNSLIENLSERKAEEKLPERRAFWQLMKIVYTDMPASFLDALRFAQIKLLLLTGLRIGEVVFIPLDWKRTRGYVDEKGRPAGESGGISESLSIRHFALKQGEPFLVEETQYVPDMFRAEVESIFEEIVRLTAPLRATLKAQYESGRFFPQYKPEQLVGAVQMYVHLTGNPIWTNPPYSDEINQCLYSYRTTFNLADLARLQDLQNETTSYLAAAVSRYFCKENREKGLILRDFDGRPNWDKGVADKFLRISDVEAYLSNHKPTKRSDLSSLRLNAGGHLAPWELLFLMPKRAVGEGRGNSVMDIVNTFSVGVADQELLMAALGENKTEDKSTIFNTYGLTPEDRALKIESYTLRHLQNAELFRVGVADAIISKRFNRRSVVQSYVYNHNSLLEDLEAIELPDEWVQVLGENKATTVAKIIVAGIANGPIVREFKKIQMEEGDQAALLFLMAEADGFHVTPYGICLNSFTVDPCPKSLECFNDCRHLSSSGLPEHRENLIVLLGRLRLVFEHASAKPDSTIGKANQIAHALKRIEGVEILLATPAGELAFPDGSDLSKPKNPGSIFDGT